MGSQRVELGGRRERERGRGALGRLAGLPTTAAPVAGASAAQPGLPRCLILGEASRGRPVPVTTGGRFRFCAL